MEPKIAPAPDAVKETGRLEAFSDGVFAIAITLLVLNLTIPQYAQLHAGNGRDRSLTAYLLTHWQVYAAYAISFLTVLVMWVIHHNIFLYIRRSDHGFLLLNGVLLMFVTIVPFPTGLLAEYIGHPGDDVTAVVIYSATFFFIATLFNLLWRYAYQKQRLIDQRLEYRQSTLSFRFTFGPVVYLVALALAFISVTASLAIFVAMTILYALPAPKLVKKA